MFQRVLATRAQWGSVLLLATVTLTSCLISIPTVALADEIPSVVATVQGQSISAEELTSALHGELMRLEIQRYQVLKDKLDELIAERIVSLEAAKRGVPVQQFIQDEIVAKVPAVTPEQVKAFYEANKNRIQQPLEKVTERLTAYLQQQEQEQRRQALLKELRPHYPVTVALQAPKIEVATDGKPALGTAGAPVTIVEFTDFQCPTCAAMQPILDEVLKSYGSKVRLVVRDYPWPRHANALKAAEAANAANAQGKFFEYTALLFKRQDALDVPSLKKYASEIGLNRARFDAELDSGKYAAEIRHDRNDAEIYGIDGTPAIFVNGVALREMSVEALRALIDRGLAAANSTPKVSSN